MVMSFCLSTF